MICWRAPTEWIEDVTVSVIGDIEIALTGGRWGLKFKIAAGINAKLDLVLPDDWWETFTVAGRLTAWAKLGTGWFSIEVTIKCTITYVKQRTGGESGWEPKCTLRRTRRKRDVLQQNDPNDPNGAPNGGAADKYVPSSVFLLSYDQAISVGAAPSFRLGDGAHRAASGVVTALGAGGAGADVPVIGVWAPQEQGIVEAIKQCRMAVAESNTDLGDDAAWSSPVLLDDDAGRACLFPTVTRLSAPNTFAIVWISAADESPSWHLKSAVVRIDGAVGARSLTLLSSTVIVATDSIVADGSAEFLEWNPEVVRNGNTVTVVFTSSSVPTEADPLATMGRSVLYAQATVVGSAALSWGPMSSALASSVDGNNVIPYVASAGDDGDEAVVVYATTIFSTGSDGESLASSSLLMVVRDASGVWHPASTLVVATLEVAPDTLACAYVDEHFYVTYAADGLIHAYRLSRALVGTAAASAINAALDDSYHWFVASPYDGGAATEDDLPGSTSESAAWMAILSVDGVLPHLVYHLRAHSGTSIVLWSESASMWDEATRDIMQYDTVNYLVEATAYYPCFVSSIASICSLMHVSTIAAELDDVNADLDEPYSLPSISTAMRPHLRNFHYGFREDLSLVDCYARSDKHELLPVGASCSVRNIGKLASIGGTLQWIVLPEGHDSVSTNVSLASLTPGASIEFNLLQDVEGTSSLSTYVIIVHLEPSVETGAGVRTVVLGAGDADQVSMATTLVDDAEIGIKRADTSSKSESKVAIALKGVSALNLPPVPLYAQRWTLSVDVKAFCTNGRCARIGKHAMVLGDLTRVEPKLIISLVKYANMSESGDDAAVSKTLELLRLGGDGVAAESGSQTIIDLVPPSIEEEPADTTDPALSAPSFSSQTETTAEVTESTAASGTDNDDVAASTQASMDDPTEPADAAAASTEDLVLAVAVGVCGLLLMAVCIGGAIFMMRRGGNNEPRGGHRISAMYGGADSRRLTRSLQTSRSATRGAVRRSRASGLVGSRQTTYLSRSAQRRGGRSTSNVFDQ